MRGAAVDRQVPPGPSGRRQSKLNGVWPGISYANQQDGRSSVLAISAYKTVLFWLNYCLRSTSCDLRAFGKSEWLTRTLHPWWSRWRYWAFSSTIIRSRRYFELFPYSQYHMIHNIKLQLKNYMVSGCALISERQFTKFHCWTSAYVAEGDRFPAWSKKIRDTCFQSWSACARPPKFKHGWCSGAAGAPRWH